MGERDEPWSHVLPIFSPLARPPRIVYATRVRDLESRLGVPTPARFDGELRKGLESCASIVGAQKPVAEGVIVVVELSAPGSNRSPPGAPGDRRQLTMGSEFKQRGAPARSAHCFRVSPDPGESWSTAMGSGRRHRQVQRRELQGKIVTI